MHTSGMPRLSQPPGLTVPHPSHLAMPPRGLPQNQSPGHYVFERPSQPYATLAEAFPEHAAVVAPVVAAAHIAGQISPLAGHFAFQSPRRPQLQVEETAGHATGAQSPQGLPPRPRLYPFQLPLPVAMHSPRMAGFSLRRGPTPPLPSYLAMSPRGPHYMHGNFIPTEATLRFRSPESFLYQGYPRVNCELSVCESTPLTGGTEPGEDVALAPARGSCPGKVRHTHHY